LLTQNGQALLLKVGLIEQSKPVMDELIDVLGRASVEAVLRLSSPSIHSNRWVRKLPQWEKLFTRSCRSSTKANHSLYWP
jgi:hypothetical protein